MPLVAQLPYTGQPFCPALRECRRKKELTWTKLRLVGGNGQQRVAAQRAAFTASSNLERPRSIRTLEGVNAVSQPQVHEKEECSLEEHQQKHVYQAWWQRRVRLLAHCAIAGASLGLWLLNANAALAKAAVHSTPPPPADGFSIGSALKGLLSFVLHLDKHLGEIIAKHGQATYAILFGIVFCETGLVLTPFLPGDSLLFACGALAAMGSLDFQLLLLIFISSAFLGDTVNYAVGNFLGSKAVEANIIKKDFITKTEDFYKKYGAKTVVLARFVPIVRTFAPFVAGIGSMNYTTFFLYNIGGAVLWSVLFTGAGLLFGNLPFVHKNFTLVVLGIVVVSVVPIVLEVLAARREQAENISQPSQGT